MNKELTSVERNGIVVMLMQALRGAISPNFRLVAIYLDSLVWKIMFVLERDDEIDREEINDIAAEFDALQDSGETEFKVEIEVTDTLLPRLDPPWIVVYHRRES